MANLIKFHKVSSLPGTPEDNSFYFVQDSENDYAESYLTDDLGAFHKIGNSQMIEDVALNIMGIGLEVVEDIDARNALDPGDNPVLAIVVDASDDLAVDEGGALYAWKPDAGEEGEWRLLAKYGELDTKVLVAKAIDESAAKTDLHDNDLFGIVDSQDNDTLKKTKYSELVTNIQGDLNVQKSIVKDGEEDDALELDGDEATPDNYKVYSVDGEGDKGWNDPTLFWEEKDW